MPKKRIFISFDYDHDSSLKMFIPYFLLSGYSNKVCQKPTTASLNDKTYRWTWSNLKSLINGGR